MQHLMQLPKQGRSLFTSGRRLSRQMAEGGYDSSEDKTSKEKDDDEKDDLGFLKGLWDKFLAWNLNSSCKSKEKNFLTELTLEGVIDYIKSGTCKHIITAAGAGISTSAGIPDFRSPGSGLYDNLQKYNIPEPSAIFELGYFKQNPEPFFVLVKSLFPSKLAPTPCHHFIKLLHDKGLLLRHYTQNIDGLEILASVPKEKVVEAHGSFRAGHCMKCKAEYSQDWMKEKIFETTIPHCAKPNCSGVVKPDVIFFGENLPFRFFNCIRKDFGKCDLLIIMGTSLVVQPFASLIDRVGKSTPRLYINLENKVGGGDIFFSYGSHTSFKYDKPGNYRDVFWKGTCDDGCMAMAKGLGWQDDLMALMASSAGEDREKQPAV